jgi:hypothetical protein
MAWVKAGRRPPAGLALTRAIASLCLPPGVNASHLVAFTPVGFFCILHTQIGYPTIIAGVALRA